jgi:hypothetical protein
MKETSHTENNLPSHPLDSDRRLLLLLLLLLVQLQWLGLFSSSAFFMRMFNVVLCSSFAPIARHKTGGFGFSVLTTVCYRTMYYCVMTEVELYMHSHLTRKRDQKTNVSVLETANPHSPILVVDRTLCQEPQINKSPYVQRRKREPFAYNLNIMRALLPSLDFCNSVFFF